ncbi:hypothetical protein pdam_00018174 [Pocillopora damicornis]|uniref:Dickkopf N-terminal cysteine-rich domain-containing protein n=1 Tax=Pocillopora damicornis TaxID=46731 RepID=A0A3M6UZ96_POCDA|nr:lectin-like [Pocillopora damicornis]RMX59006.1 hypothetical protein pdam_00018174 [Pocillopora damicornis]
MRLEVLLLAFVATVYCEPFVEEQDPLLMDQEDHATEKRHHNYYCLARGCYYNGHCPSGYYCHRYYRRCCRLNPRRCSHKSHCSSSQCCAKYSYQYYGYCRSLKQPGGWCPWKGPDGYNCGCGQGYTCQRYGSNYYWGKCVASCSRDSSCKKTECCSGRRCKPRKGAGKYCPRKGADIYHCGCIEGYECQDAGVGKYWGKCVKVAPPTEEPGSGLGE